MFSDECPLKNSDFEGKVNGGFDVIVSNPPYLVLKPDKKKNFREIKLTGLMSGVLVQNFGCLSLCAGGNVESVSALH